MSNLKKQIEEWGKEYDVNYNNISVIYSWIDSHTIGITSFHTKDTRYYLVPPYNDKSRCCNIKITNVFIDHPIASKAVLWHEFCHAEVWIKEGKTEGHGDKWVGRLWRKPLLTLLDGIYTHILFMFLKHR